MNQNVNPVTAFIIVLVAILLISLVFWARQAALMVGGPDQVQVDPDGNVFIHIADKLYKLNPSLELIDEVDLASLGVHNLVGDFAFFGNGDLLIRRGQYQPGFFESIFRYGRLPDTSQPIAKQEGEGLYRCVLENRQCTAFGPAGLDFDSAFHLSIDWTTDTVYLSDTGRHKLRKYDATGKELAVQHSGYRFPNQLMLQDDRLLVADTNHHAIQEAQTATDSYGNIVQTHRVDGNSPGGDSWTYSFAKVGDQWWVNNMGHTMSHGTVAIYDKQWRFQQAVDLPKGADPIDFAVLQQRVLITDLGNITIYQLGFDGRLLELPLPQNLGAQLSTLRENQKHYLQLSYAMVGLFILFLIGGFSVAISQARDQAEPQINPSAAEMHVNIMDPAINWIPFNKQYKLILKLAMLGPFLLIPVTPIVFSKFDFLKDILPLTVFILIAVISPLLMRKIFSMGVGTLGEILIIKKSNKEFAAGKGPNIFYSKNNILIGDIYIPFNQQQMLFDTQRVVTDVMPLLRDATYVKSGQMLNMIIKRQKPMHIILIAALVLGIVILFMASVYR